MILVKLGIGDPHTMLLSNLFMKMLAVKVILCCSAFEFCENWHRDSHTFVMCKWELVITCVL